eukprot:GHVU01083294.1.p1 GENE.GHVU01083294.1~~GHVU01083294.1.p1  ORF type:complete len:497 (-),score=94.57 GHVU01083294.1:443-1933(-)
MSSVVVPEVATSSVEADSRITGGVTQSPGANSDNMTSETPTGSDSTAASPADSGPRRRRGSESAVVCEDSSEAALPEKSIVSGREYVSTTNGEATEQRSKAAKRGSKGKHAAALSAEDAVAKGDKEEEGEEEEEEEDVEDIMAAKSVIVNHDPTLCETLHGLAAVIFILVGWAASCVVPMAVIYTTVVRPNIPGALLSLFVLLFPFYRKWASDQHGAFFGAIDPSDRKPRQAAKGRGQAPGRVHGRCADLTRRFLRGLAYWGGKGSGVVYEEGARDTSKPKIVCVHPHGVFNFGLFLLSSEPFVSSCRFIVAPFMYWFAPVLRLVVEEISHLGDSSRKSFREYLSRGESLILIPGGFHEATASVYARDRLFIKKRKGFVKYALEHGYELQPVFMFGENHLYRQAQGMWGLRFYLNEFGVPGVIFWGSRLFPLLPKRNPIMVAVGKPMAMPTIPKPTELEVNKWHSLYVDRVRELYHTHAVKYYGELDFKHKELEIW